MINRKGFSLVEALISTVIVGMILAAGAWLFFANQKTTTLEITASLVRANLRQALNVIGKDIVQAGMLSRATKINLGNALIRPIEGGNRSYKKYNSNLNLGKCIGYNSNNIDKIQIISPDPVNSAYATQDLSSGNTTLHNIKIDANNSPINNNYRPSTGDYYIITNANYLKNPFDPANNPITNIFKLRGATFVSGYADHGLYNFSITPRLKNNFSSNAGLCKVNIHYYYVKYYNSQKPPKLPELRCYIRNLRRTYVVAEGIEDMQFSYGVDINGNNKIDSNEWIQNPLTISDNDYYKLRAIKVTICAISRPLPKSYLGKKKDENDIYYVRPQIEDRPKNANPKPFPSDYMDYPVYRLIASETYYLRNFMPDSFYGNTNN